MLIHLHRLVTTAANTEQRKQGMEEVTYEQRVAIHPNHILWVEANSGKVRIAISDGTVWIVKETIEDIEKLMKV